MAILTPDLAAAPVERLRDVLDEGARRARASGRPMLVSVSERIGDLDPLAVFAAAVTVGAQPLYWEHQDRDGEPLVMAGAGIAHQVVADGPERFPIVAAAWRSLLTDAVIQAPNDWPDAGPRMLGGGRFDPLRPASSTWEGFPAAGFVLPRFTVTRRDNATLLTTNAVLVPAMAAEEEVAAAITWARADLLGRAARWTPPNCAMRTPSPAAHDALSSLEDVGQVGAWQEMVARTAREIRAGRFAKVVLARQARLRFPGRGTGATINTETQRHRESTERGYGETRGGVAFMGEGGIGAAATAPWETRAGRERESDMGARAVRALARLRAAYPGSFLFAFGGPRAGGSALFLGASPERLVRLHAGTVEAACLAGSIRRGATPEEDAQLGAALLAGAKDRAEHAVVARMLREALDPLCASLDMPTAPSLLRLPTVQHLSTPIRGRLAAGGDGATAPCILDLVARLHPTPAVGGYPTAEALAAIREREGFDRGWYAGPVGWLDRRGEGDFAVAIRSALLHEHAPATSATPSGEATLFAGCGIMGDSDPAAEYQESRLKMRVMLSALVD